jgi:hypothetical protein
LLDAYDNLPEWAWELVQLSPRALDGFGRGEALVTEHFSIPATEDPAFHSEAAGATGVLAVLRGARGARSEGRTPGHL